MGRLSLMKAGREREREKVHTTLYEGSCKFVLLSIAW